MAKTYELSTGAVAALTELVTLTMRTSTVLDIKMFRVSTERISSKENKKTYHPYSRERR